MKTKREFMNIYLFEMDTLAKHFEEMAEKGWMLKNISMSRIHYEECEPQKVHFFIDIYTKGGYLNPQIISSDEETYGDFISEYGYEYVTRTSNFQVFLTHQEDIIPIHEDEQEIKKAQRKTIIKYELYNRFMIILILFLNFFLLDRNRNLYTFTSNISLLLYLIIPLLLIVIIYRTYPTIKWLIKKDNYHITTSQLIRRNKLINRASFVLVVYLVITFLSSQFTTFIPIIAMLAISSLSFFLLDPLLARFIKKYHSVVSLVLCLYIGMLINVNFFIFHMPSEPNNQQAGILSYQDFRNDLPDIKESNLEYHESFVLKEESYFEYYNDTQYESRNAQENIYFNYELYTIYTPFLESYIQDIAIQDDYRPFTLVEESTSENVSYKLYANEYKQCLIWDEFILMIDVSDPLKKTQIATIINRI